MVPQHRMILVLFCGLILVGVGAAGAQDADAEPTAAEMFEGGMKLYLEGQYSKAKELLRDVDAMQLPKEERVVLWETIQEIDRRVNPTAEPNELLVNGDELRKNRKNSEATVEYPCQIIFGAAS